MCCICPPSALPVPLAWLLLYSLDNPQPPISSTWFTVGYTRSLQGHIRPLLPRYQPLCFQYYSPSILLRHPSNKFPVTVTSDSRLAAPLLHPRFSEPSQAHYCKVPTCILLTQGSFSYGTSPLSSSSSSSSLAPQNGPYRYSPFIFTFLAGVWEEKAGKTSPLEWACLIWCLFSVLSAHHCLMDFIYDVQRKKKKIEISLPHYSTLFQGKIPFLFASGCLFLSVGFSYQKA